jgi:hypothetical protein
LTTLHGRQDLGALKPFYSRFGEMPLVSISDDQRKPLPQANFCCDDTPWHTGRPASAVVRAGQLRDDSKLMEAPS